MKKYVGYKFVIYPTKYQIHQLSQYFGYARFVYNLGKTLYDEYHEQVKDDPDVKLKYLDAMSLHKTITKMKNSDETYSWLKKFDSHTCGLVLSDLMQGYIRFYKNVNDCNPPVYKKKKNCWKSFPIRKDRMRIIDDQLYIPGFDSAILIKCVPEMLQGCGNKHMSMSNSKFYNGRGYINYINPRVIYNGVHYYLSFAIEMSDDIKPNSCKNFIDNEIWNNKEYTDIVGIDWGAKHENWLVASNGMTLERPNHDSLDKQIAGYQRKFDRQQRINDETIERTNQYTKNELKTLKRRNKLEKKRANQKGNKLHEFVNAIIETKPEAVVIEDLKLSSLLDDDKPSNVQKQIKDAIPYRCREVITNKCEANGIPVIIADEQFKSTQTCSRCGFIQKMGSQRVYKCPCCGLVIDRDLNASYNLRNYGHSLLHRDNDLICA